MSHESQYAPLFRKAFALAEQAKGEVEPNPLVGALVLQGDQIIGKGFHVFYGGAHAEVVALEEAKGRGDAILVTLEPCSTQGKTPPCTEALIRSKIRKVIVGCTDPFPTHRGAGIQALRAAGREVIVMDFQQEWEKQNRPFLKFLNLKRPWVIAKWAMTLDGKIASASGDSKWVSSPVSREEVWKLRGRCEAVATGIGSVLADDPRLSSRSFQTLYEPALRVVFDSRLQTPLTSKLVQNKEARTLLIASSKAAKSREKALKESGCEVMRAGKGTQTSIPAALETLRSRGVKRMLLEAGPALTGAFLQAGCIDQVIAYVAPKLLGGKDSKSPVGGENMAKMEEAIALADWSWESVGPDLRINGFL